jgi:hypothetical protein
MTSTVGRMRSTLRSWGHRTAASFRQQLRALMPPLTPKVVFWALIGLLLFLGGLLRGIWLIIRTRRQDQDSVS